VRFRRIPLISAQARPSVHKRQQYPFPAFRYETLLQPPMCMGVEICHNERPDPTDYLTPLTMTPLTRWILKENFQQKIFT